MSFALMSAPRQLVCIPVATAAAADLHHLMKTTAEALQLPVHASAQPDSLKFQTVAALLHQSVETAMRDCPTVGVVIRCKASEIIVHYTQHLLALLASIIHDRTLAMDLQHLSIDATSQLRTSGCTLDLCLEFVGAATTDFKTSDVQRVTAATELATSIGATLHTAQAPGRWVASIHVPMEPAGGVEMSNAYLQLMVNQDAARPQMQAS